MIFNPVIAGGASKAEYAISDATSYGFPASAYAGDFVSSEEQPETSTQDILIQDADGNSIPYLISSNLPSETRAGPGGYEYLVFVMPASDITIAYA